MARESRVTGGKRDIRTEITRPIQYPVKLTSNQKKKKLP